LQLPRGERIVALDAGRLGFARFDRPGFHQEVIRKIGYTGGDRAALSNLDNAGRNAADQT